MKRDNFSPILVLIAWYCPAVLAFLCTAGGLLERMIVLSGFFCVMIPGRSPDDTDERTIAIIVGTIAATFIPVYLAVLHHGIRNRDASGKWRNSLVLVSFFFSVFWHFFGWVGRYGG